jgi:hypothetical protein
MARGVEVFFNNIEELASGRGQELEERARNVA